MQVWGRQDNIQDCNRMSKTDEETIKPWRWSVDNQLVGAFVSGVGWSQHSPRCCGGIRKKKVIVSIPSEFAVYKILGDLRKNTGKAPAEDRMTKCYLLLNWPVGFRHLESLADINIFSTEGDCTFKSTAQENISVCQVSAKPSWKKKDSPDFTSQRPQYPISVSNDKWHLSVDKANGLNHLRTRSCCAEHSCWTSREHLEVRKSLFVQEPSGEKARKQAALVLVWGQLLIRSWYSGRKELSRQEGSSQARGGAGHSWGWIEPCYGHELCLHASARSLLFF